LTGVHLSTADRDDGAIDFKGPVAVSINMTILLMLIVSFSIALAGVGQF
jgi:hypothetical protein